MLPATDVIRGGTESSRLALRQATVYDTVTPMRFASLLVVACLAGSCGPRAPAPAPGGTAARGGGPGSGAFESDGDRRLVGLGAASPAEGGAAGETARARAQGELAALVEVLLAGVLEAVPALGPQERVLVRLAQQGFDVGAAWTGPDDLVYATATLLVDPLAAAVSRAPELPSELAQRAGAAVLPSFYALLKRGVRPPMLPDLAPAAPAAADAGAAPCLVRLTAHRPINTASCIVNDRLARWQGVLRYACGGGEAEALFGDGRFVGTVEHGVVNVALIGLFHFADGCSWRSEQRLEGELGSGVLRYRYDEAPLPDQKDCEDACSLEREVRVEG